MTAGCGPEDFGAGLAADFEDISVLDHHVEQKQKSRACARLRSGTNTSSLIAIAQVRKCFHVVKMMKTAVSWRAV
jgi:hypothetical protein